MQWNVVLATLLLLWIAREYVKGLVRLAIIAALLAYLYRSGAIEKGFELLQRLLLQQ